MSATEVSFSKVGNVWQATTDSLGSMMLQIKRKGSGRIRIEHYIDGMEPLTCKELPTSDVNVLIPFSSPVGMKLKIISETEVEKAMLMGAVYEKPHESTLPGNIITDSDIVNTLDSTDSKKVLSAAQGKALKDLIPVAASTDKAGVVRMMANIADPSADTVEAVKTTVIQILAQLKTALIMKTE